MILRIVCAAKAAHEIKAILVVQVDTASGVCNDIAALRRAIDAAGHPALFMVDCIASLGCVEYRMDDWGVDITVSGSQKGLMVPPGLGLVWASDKAMAAHKTANMRSPYWDWTARLSETSPLSALLRHGAHPTHLRNARCTRHDGRRRPRSNLGHAMRYSPAPCAPPLPSGQHRVDWNATSSIRPNAQIRQRRSSAAQSNASRLHRLCQDGAGLTLGGSASANSLSRSFRIGHMGHMNPPTILGTLGTIEAVLTSMGAPMGASGAAAAAGHIASALDHHLLTKRSGGGRGRLR